MRLKYLLFVAVYFYNISTYSADPKYPVSAIAPELLVNVNAVYRADETTFRILAKNRAKHIVHLAITILNEKGKHYAEEVIFYDKQKKIRDISGTCYDAAGKIIKRLKNSEIYDQAAYDGSSLFNDSRLKVIDLSHGTYPYTVEFDYEVEYQYLLHIPSFAVSSEKASVEHSSYSLEYAQGLAPRYKAYNITTSPVKSTTKDGLESLTWTFDNVKPMKREPLGPSYEDFLQLIVAAPSSFQYDEYTGKMDSWEEFGRWISTLNKGRNNLNEKTKLKIKELTKNATSVEEKVKILYEYLQSKTRYVGIQLGIGGFQPFEASLVDETGYGDCKALSNYMTAMLDVVGIKSHYALIHAGDDASSLRTDFPSSQFNHAIVAVPNVNDTIWLECTSQSNPFGYQGTFTGDRKALLITDDGAKVVNTTRYGTSQNIQARTAEVFVDLNGNAKAKVRTTYSGLQYENNNLDRVLNNQYDEQKKWIEEDTDIPSFDLNGFSMANKKDRIPSAIVSLDLTLNRYASVSGKRIFLIPNLMNRSTYIPEKMESRKMKVVRKNCYTDLDTIRYNLPEGIYPEFLPQPVKVSNRFGEYEASFQLDQGSLVYIRRVKMNKGEFAPETYNELVDFYKSMNKADNTKLVFLSKT